MSVRTALLSRVFSAWWLCLGAAALSACSLVKPAPAPIQVSAPVIEPTPLKRPTPFEQPRKPAPPRLAHNQAPAVPAPVASAPDIAVIGLSQDDARKAFGTPAQRIDQGPGQAWIYKNPRCTVEILFFLDVSRNGYYALDRKISGTDGSAASERSCLSDIQNARQQ